MVTAEFTWLPVRILSSAIGDYDVRGRAYRRLTALVVRYGRIRQNVLMLFV